MGTIFDIKRYAIHDGPGIRTTVFFKGCPLNCQWCHNPESRSHDPEEFEIIRTGGESRKETIGRIVSVDEVMDEIERDRVFYEESGGGATFSGGEPLEQIEFLRAVLHACKDRGISAAVDTSGHCPPEYFEKIDGLVDYYLYDLKLMDDARHREFVGVSNDLILANLRWLAENDATIHIRIPLIPGITDTDENLGAILSHLDTYEAIHEISLLPYNLLGEDKCARFTLPQPLGHLGVQGDSEIEAIRKKFTDRGYDVHIGG